MIDHSVGRRSGRRETRPQLGQQPRMLGSGSMRRRHALEDPEGRKDVAQVRRLPALHLESSRFDKAKPGFPPLGWMMKPQQPVEPCGIEQRVRHSNRLEIDQPAQSAAVHEHVHRSQVAVGENPRPSDEQHGCGSDHRLKPPAIRGR